MRARPPLLLEHAVRPLLAWAWFLLLAPGAVAQLSFGDLRGRHLPPHDDQTWAVALGDLDGDGDNDLVVANSPGQNRLYLNEGRGIFTDATGRMPAYTDHSKGVALGDVDADGDLDIVFANELEQSRLYLNDGTASFDDVTLQQLPHPGSSVDVEVGDLDGDGDLDLVFTNLLFLNDGMGTFSAGAIGTVFDYRQGDLSSVALGDVDADGDLDIVLGNDPYFLSHPPAAVGGQDLLFLNDGTGTFTGATNARMPRDNDFSRSMTFGDVDGDGDLDLIISNRLYLNDGTGTFSDATASHLPPGFARSSVALGDVDGDGDPDLVSGKLVYVNDGSGTFAEAAGRIPPDEDSTPAVALGDVDGDGDLDLAFGNLARNRLLLNDGTGTFADATAAVLPPDKGSDALALGDVDGDGDDDLVLGNTLSGQNGLYLNDGTGTFSDATNRLPPDTDWTDSVALGDVDGDRDLDLVLGNHSGQDNRLYLNDGSGTFADATAGRMLPPDQGRTRDMALGDVDGDGDPDLVFGNDSDQNRIYLNDGTGTFTDATAGRMPPDGDSTRAVVLGDVDGDGDLDLAFGNSGQDRLYLNDGTGTFSDATVRMPRDTGSTWALAMGDVDGDSDLDLVVGNGRQDRLYLNDGTGTFVDASDRIPEDHVLTKAAVLGDLDGDGDLDLVLGKSMAQNRVFSNLLRHTHTPYLLIPGSELRIEVYARYGAPRLLDAAFVFLSTATARIPLPPLGTIGIELSLAAQLAPFLIPRTTGVGSTSLMVPNDPNLVGVPVYAQSLLLQYPTLRLTNVEADRIVR